jgi:hypothetical protein
MEGTDEESITPGMGTDSPIVYVFSDQELDDLLAPIALYPDPLPALTYPEEIDNPDAWLKKRGTVSGING